MVDATPESITPLGKRNEMKSRPIMVKMSKTNGKELIITSLGKLKQAPDNYKRISITGDYKFEERQAIRNKVTEGKTKTVAEGNIYGKCVISQKTSVSQR